MNKHVEITQMYEDLKQYFNNNLGFLKKGNVLAHDQLGLDFIHEMENFYKFCMLPELADKVIVGVGYGAALQCPGSAAAACRLFRALLASMLSISTSVEKPMAA